MTHLLPRSSALASGTRVRKKDKSKMPRLCFLHFVEGKARLERITPPFLLLLLKLLLGPGLFFFSLPYFFLQLLLPQEMHLMGVPQILLQLRNLERREREREIMEEDRRKVHMKFHDSHRGAGGRGASLTDRKGKPPCGSCMDMRRLSLPCTGLRASTPILWP